MSGLIAFVAPPSPVSSDCLPLTSDSFADNENVNSFLSGALSPPRIEADPDGMSNNHCFDRITMTFHHRLHISVLQPLRRRPC